MEFFIDNKIIVALDAMGGDNAPHEIVKGAKEALVNEKVFIKLVGNEHIIKQSLGEYDSKRIEIVNASQVIETSEQPTSAIKNKKDSSLVVGLNLLKNNEAHAFVSAGNTGALLAGATLITGRIKGIERPALAPLIPTRNKFTLLIDAGANVDSKPSYLLQFAKMGSVYLETVVGIKNPKVGLVNIGSEEEKGNALTKETFPLLKESGLNFIGNVEAREIPYGVCDVCVCDAFVGNVILKLLEGFAKSTFDSLKEDLSSSPVSKIGALLAKDGFKKFKNRFEFDDVGGAPFLGLKSLVVKAHGSSNSRAIKGAINQCVLFNENDFVNKLINTL